MHRGWVRLWRKSRDSTVYTDDLWRLFCHCLIRANHKPTKVFVHGLAEPIKVQTGQFITGREALHKELYPPKTTKSIPSAKTLWRRLVVIQKLGNVSIQTTRRYSLITICGFETYNPPLADVVQPDVQPDVQPVSNRCPTGVQPESNRTKEERKKVTKERKKKEARKKVKKKGGQAADSLDSVAYPAGMDTPAVRQAVTTWLAYKQKRGESYKDPTDQITLLLEMPRFNHDPATFVAAVNHSRANNWAGCFPPKESDRGNQTPKPGQTVQRSGRVHGQDYSRFNENRPPKASGAKGTDRDDTQGTPPPPEPG